MTLRTLIVLVLLSLLACDKSEPAAEKTDETAEKAVEKTEEAKPEEGTAAETAETDEAEEEEEEINTLGELAEAPAGESRGVAHILIRYKGGDRTPSSVTRSKEEAKARAESALAKAKEDFAAAVTEFSEDDATKEHEGELGDLEAGILPKPFDAALFGMPVGEIQGPVETDLGFHIVKRLR